jgi:hypothetical protein
MGIAIYNGVILDLHFPMACYKKLLDLEPNLHDLKDLEPKLASSLEYILNDKSEDLENLLYQNFIVEEDMFGETITTELIPGGADTFVNQDNKEEYVKLIVDHIFNKSAE